MRNDIFEEKFAHANEYSESLIEAIKQNAKKMSGDTNINKKKLTKEEKKKKM